MVGGIIFEGRISGEDEARLDPKGSEDGQHVHRVHVILRGPEGARGGEVTVPLDTVARCTIRTFVTLHAQRFP